MKKHRITGLKSLRRRKAELQADLAFQHNEIVNAVEEVVWPLQVFRKYRRTAEDVAENKFFVIGIQLAQAILGSLWGRKDKQEDAPRGIADFVKQVAEELVSRFSKKETDKEQEHS